MIVAAAVVAMIVLTVIVMTMVIMPAGVVVMVIMPASVVVGHHARGRRGRVFVTVAATGAMPRPTTGLTRKAKHSARRL